MTATATKAKRAHPELVARARQRTMHAIERNVSGALRRVLRAQEREAARRVEAERDPVPYDYNTRWADAVLDAQRPGGRAAARAGWDAAGDLVAAGARKVDDDDAEFLTSPTTAQVDEYFRRTSRRAAQVHADEIDDVFERIKRDPDMQGLSAARIARELTQRLGNFPQNYANLLARTGVVWANNRGAMERYRAAGVRAKRWWATEDELTCPFCEAMHTEVVEIDRDFVGPGGRVTAADGTTLDIPLHVGAIAHPPVHANCRCVLLPETLLT